MKIDNVRRLAGLVFACALSACAGSSSADNATNSAANAATTADAAPAATAAPQSASSASDSSNPCHLPGLWAFAGACTAGVLTAAGGTFVLPSYRNLAAVMDYGKNDASRRVAFVVGDATGAGDVTGLLNGALPFPLYGSVPCLSPRDAPVVCDGEAMLYLLVINVSDIPVRFASTPQIQVSNLAGISSKLCEVKTMAWSDSRQTKAVWRSHAWTAPVIGKTVTFPAVQSQQGYKSQGALVVYAVTCG
jgi:hypothetical protein